MSSHGRSKAQLAAKAWAAMFEVMMASTSTRARSLTARGLTPNDARALWSLSTEERRPIGALAQAWECDPSNATFIVNRLEQAGLVDRQDNPSDRRVKLIGLTAKGARIKEELLAEYRVPPPELLRLDATDLRALLDLLKKIEVKGQ
jgi:DNA-binding MarR family transcriptional regulator